MLRAEGEDGVRRLGDGLQLQMPVRRQRSISENLLTFAVIPALLLWSLIFLLVGGDLKGAVQFACALLAGGFVGWSLGEIR